MHVEDRASRMISFLAPPELYAKLDALAGDFLTSPAAMAERLIAEAVNQRNKRQ